MLRGSSTGQIRVLISSHPRDDEFRQELETHLAPLIHNGTLELISERVKVLGTHHDSATSDRRIQADVIILLISSEYVGSRNHYYHELRPALEGQLRGEVRIAPVIVRPTLLSLTPLKDYEVIPGPTDAVSTWRHRDQAWVLVLERLQQLFVALRPDQGAKVLLESDDPDPEMRIVHRDYQLARGRLARLRAEAVFGEPLEQAQAEVGRLRRLLREGRQMLTGDLLDDRYLIREMLGRGGFATIWRARDVRTDRQVVVRVLRGDYIHDRSHRERFIRGCQIMLELNHPHIVRVLEPACTGRISTPDLPDSQPFCYFVMEYLEGGDLQGVLLKRTPGPDIWTIFHQVAQALEAVHARGFIHRDVKPGNILLTSEGVAKLTDFDLARTSQTSHGTRTGSLGTVFYAAPELHMPGIEPDARADIYSLAMTMLMVLRKTLPDHTVLRDLGRLLAELQPRGLAAVMEKALEIDRVKRYASMAEFRQALNQQSRKAQSAAPGPAMPAGRPVTNPGPTPTPASSSLKAPTSSPKIESDQDEPTSPFTLESARTVAIAGGRGTGKSLIAASLSVALAQAGLTIILADADRSDIYDHFGIAYPSHELDHFIHNQVATLEEVLLTTPIPRLKLISGAGQIKSVRSPRDTLGTKIARHLQKLKPDHLVVDLGSDMSFASLDFFNQASRRLIVLSSEPKTIKSGYGFLKSAVYRMLVRRFENTSLPAWLWGEEIERNEPTETIKQVIAAAERRDPELGRSIISALEEYKVEVILNMTSPPMNAKVFSVLRSVSVGFLALEPILLGTIPPDEKVMRAATQNTPFLLAYPESEAARRIRIICETFKREHP